MMEAFFRLDMKAAAQVGGCPICAIIVLRTERYLRFFLHEHVLDPHLRLRLLASYGFCNLHGWWLVQIAAKIGEELGVATVYEHLTDELRHQVQRALAASSPKAASESLRPQEICPLCEHAETWEQDTLAALLQALANPQTRESAQQLYAETDGLCLPHLRCALLMTNENDVAAFLLQDANSRLQRLHDDLEEFCRKHDYRFHDEPMSESERCSWVRAIEAFVGKHAIPHERADQTSTRRRLRRWLKLG
ncbi:hypothetical protein HRbin17_01296 [bacterium HR17]|jgi:hypothetical protein|uniref:Uncharacterized protein n=1 Tax=Candidatus Fervidibacter japonicus TaxID=2035412 RepID=A0A2H5XC72_9BACT|nr:hypothetical protein HRbin17_01296 [bacterium HR17]